MPGLRGRIYLILRRLFQADYGRRQTVFEQAFKNIDDVLWKEAGCTTELDYTEQTSWLLFLKYLDGLEQDLADEAAVAGKRYNYILDEAYRWDVWAAPKTKNGTLDHNNASTGDDLRDFVNQRLFPYLQGFKQKAAGPNTVEYKIARTAADRQPAERSLCGPSHHARHRRKEPPKHPRSFRKPTPIRLHPAQQRVGAKDT